MSPIDLQMYLQTSFWIICPLEVVLLQTYAQHIHSKYTLRHLVYHVLYVDAMCVSVCSCAHGCVWVCMCVCMSACCVGLLKVQEVDDVKLMRESKRKRKSSLLSIHWFISRDPYLSQSYWSTTQQAMDWWAIRGASCTECIDNFTGVIKADKTEENCVWPFKEEFKRHTTENSLAEFCSNMNLIGRCPMVSRSYLACPVVSCI